VHRTVRRLRPIDGILVFGISYLVSTIITVFLRNVLSIRANTGVAAAILFVVAVLLLRVVTSRPLSYAGFRRVSPRIVMFAVIASIAIIVPAMSLEAVVMHHFEIPQELIDALNEIIKAETVPELLYVLLVAAVGAALSEELVFRGILQNSLASRMKGWAAMLIASGVFGLLHTIWRFPPAFVLGLFLGVLYWRTGSLLPSLAAHLTINSVSIVMVFLVGLRGEMMMPLWIRQEAPAPLWMILVSAFVFVLSLRAVWSESTGVAPQIELAESEEIFPRIDI
jgi:membrane protease YdiL (CAAX protease family)